MTDEMERLAYQNRFVRQLVQDDLNYEASEATPQVISGPDNLVLLRVSLEEWIKLTSSLFTGADICYPSESDNVRWILYRAVEQPMDLCALIANCIATSEATQQALRDFVANDPGMQQILQTTINKGAPLLPEIEGQVIVENDDLDALFGAVTFLVDTIHDAIVDFNQDAEAANNSRELGAIIFEALPIIETLPFDQMSQYIDTLFEQIIEVFDSQWDTTPITGTRDRIRCALFCIAIDNDNSLTWSLIQDYFYGLTGFSWTETFNIMLEFANFLQTGTWTGEEVVDIAFGNFAAAMSGMGKFGDMLFPSLGALMQLGQNDPDPDHATLCDCTPPDPDCNDLTASASGWVATNASGTPSSIFGYYAAGQGLAPAASGTAYFYHSRQPIGGSPTVLSLTFNFNQAVTNFGVQRLGGAFAWYTGAATTSITIDSTTHPSFFPLTLGSGSAIGITFTTNIAPSSAFRVVEFCWEPV